MVVPPAERSHKRNASRDRLGPGLTVIKAGAAARWYGCDVSETPLIPPDQAKVLALAAETQYAPNGIVSRTLLRTPNGRMVLFGFDAGQELTEHTSPHHAVVHVLSGRCEWKLGDETRELQAGELLYMPPQLPHAVKALERFSMLLTLTLAGPKL
jgi:quercetin dioxygenase-like cupin family protein